MPKNVQGLYCRVLKYEKDAKMTHVLKMLVLVAIISLVSGCGQKGNLYMPSEQVSKWLGL